MKAANLLAIAQAAISYAQSVVDTAHCKDVLKAGYLAWRTTPGNQATDIARDDDNRRSMMAATAEAYRHLRTGKEPRADSRDITQHLGNPHETVMRLVNDYRADFEQFGILRFQIGEIQGRGQPEKFALLNEDQTYLLLTYSRNTARVRALKVKLVQAFGAARRPPRCARPSTCRPTSWRTTHCMVLAATRPISDICTSTSTAC